MEIDWEAAFAFWNWSDDRLGFFHMYCAIAALALGPVIFLLRKGDFLHRLLGLGYMFAMLATNATALLIYDFTGGINIFHFFAIVSLITSLGGLVCILYYGATKAVGALAGHIEFMCWSYFGAFMAGGAEIFTRGMGPQIDSMAAFWTIFAIYMIFIGGIGNVVAVRAIRRVKRSWLPQRA